MSRGRTPDPQRAKRGTGHRPAAGEEIVEYAPGAIDLRHRDTVASELPEGLPRDVFIRAVDELGDKLRDTDLEALRIMAWAIHRSNEAQMLVEEHGMMISSEWGPKVNPMLKVARDEAALYLKIADQYALTFVSRLRAGVLQLAGQSMLQQIHEQMADAIVARIVAK